LSGVIEMSVGYYTRMGDGKRVTMTKAQIIDDLHAGSADAADMGEIPVLNADAIDQLFDIISDKNRVVGVEPGKEVVLTYDIGQLDFTGDNGNSGNGVDIGRLEAALIHERAMGADTFELAHADYSIKPVKPVISNEMQTMEEIQNEIIVPYFYGAMPNMGLYYAPDGPYGNPADLMREFKIEEAMKQAELASAHMAKDIEYVSTHVMAAGSDGFDFDTTASAGDADFVGTLKGVELLRKACPSAYINVGMAGESVMGIHGSIEYNGQVVAGLYPHQQCKLAEKAGANVFGAVVNTNSSKSLSWNLARSVTFVKECIKECNIPVHVNMGMGVGGIPMFETAPIDAVTRCNKAMVEVANVDGV
jgi:dimethylamine---corrinoid protein Co-methyltransferase